MRTAALTVVTTLVVLSASFHARAKCMAGSLSASPRDGSTIATDAVFVVTAYGEEQPLLSRPSGLAAKLTRADGAKPSEVALNVIATYRGEMGITQVLLRPAARLAPGPWKLDIAGKRDAVHATYTVTAEPGPLPRWLSSSEAVRGAYQEYGCGPESNVEVAVPVEHAPWVRATVRKQGATSPAVTALLLVKDGKVSVGHGMCSGEFVLQQGQKYDLTLEAIGENGSAVPSSFGDRLVVVGPTPPPREQ